MEFIGNFINSLNAAAAPKAKVVTDEMVKAEACKMARRGFIFDEQSFDLLRAYLKCRSGLLVLGNVGVGKTFFFKALSIPVLSMQRVGSHTIAEVRSALEDFRNEEILVDDIGTEAEFNNFGVKMDILTTILEERLQIEKRTHFTSNLSVEQIFYKYGARTFDRIKELAMLFKCEGKSKRKANGVWIEAIDVFDGRLWKQCAARCRFYDANNRVCIHKVRREPSKVESCVYF